MSSNCTACGKTVLFILTRNRLFLFRAVAMESIKCVRRREGGHRENALLHRMEVENMAALCLYIFRPLCYCASQMGPYAFNLHLRVFPNENLWGYEIVLVDGLQYPAGKSKWLCYMDC